MERGDCLDDGEECAEGSQAQPGVASSVREGETARCSGGSPPHHDADEHRFIAQAAGGWDAHANDYGLASSSPPSAHYDFGLASSTRHEYDYGLASSSRDVNDFGLASSYHAAAANDFGLAASSGDAQGFEVPSGHEQPTRSAHIQAPGVERRLHDTATVLETEMMKQMFPPPMAPGSLKACTRRQSSQQSNFPRPRSLSGHSLASCHDSSQASDAPRPASAHAAAAASSPSHPLEPSHPPLPNSVSSSSSNIHSHHRQQRHDLHEEDQAEGGDRMPYATPGWACQSCGLESTKREHVTGVCFLRRDRARLSGPRIIVFDSMLQTTRAARLFLLSF